MVKGLYTAWTGMVNEMNRLDVITNNLANADTNGYKKEGATAESFKNMLSKNFFEQYHRFLFHSLLVGFV